MIARILSGIIGLFMLWICVGWVIDPESAAISLEMPLLEGMARNTQIGDFSAFFFTAGLFSCIAAYRAEYVWLYASISLLGSAAIFRSLSVVVHGADPLTSAIVGEIIKNEPAENAGLLAGDKIISIDGFNVSGWDDIKIKILPF